MKVVVSDSSPLNYLALLSDFDLLRLIYGTVVIPPAVYVEVVERGAGYPVQEAVRAALGEWIILSEAPNPTTVRMLLQDYRLDLGELKQSLSPNRLTEHLSLWMNGRVSLVRGRVA